MVSSKELYYNYLVLVYATFFLFVCLISIFGFIFFYLLQKRSKKNWGLNYFESFVICFAIGISIYISICFILDIFKSFNFFTAYLSIIIIDAVFIGFLIYHGELDISLNLKFLKSIKEKIKAKPKDTLILIVILAIVISFQIWTQWVIITKKLALTSKDTYVWLGQSWYLLEKGYLWREHMPIHYPKGYTFFLAGPELIYPNWRFAYFFYKFGGIPFFTFYIIVIAIILKRIFQQNYIILIGLLLILLSGFLFSRFNSFTSSTIPTLLILISIIIFISKCPFYLVGFLIPAIFLTNGIFGLFYITIIIFLLLIKLVNSKENLSNILKDDITKTLIIAMILLIPYILHAFYVKNFNFIDIIFNYLDLFGIFKLKIAYNSQIELDNYTVLLAFRHTLDDLFPHNDFLGIFLDIEKRILSFFFIFTISILFLPTKKFFNEKFWQVINFGKLSVLLILIFYSYEIFSIGSSNVISDNIGWFKWRTVEALAGPSVILTCFMIEKIIEKAKILTNYLVFKSNFYRKLIRRNNISKFVRIEYILISILLVSICSIVIAHQRIYYSYYFEDEHIETVFYIKENIPDDSKILVSDFDHTTNSFYNLLSTYKYYIWDFEFSENTFNETLDYIREKGIDYILLDDTRINSTEKRIFKSYPYFEEVYENNINVLLEVE